MKKLDKLVLESYREVLSEMPKGATLKVKDIPQAMIKRLEKQYGPVDRKDDFFDSDMDTYFKFTGRNKTTGSVEHKIIRLPSFFKLYQDFEDIVADIKSLMRSDDIRKDTAARELFELIKTNFRKLQRYLRTERPEQYSIIRSRVALEGLVRDFKIHCSLIAEQKGLLDEALDHNDPILIKLRAKKIADKKGAEKISQIKRAHPKADIKSLKKIKLLASLRKRREEIMRDMEQEAEPEGGPIADKYGDMLNKIDAAIARTTGQKEMDYDTAVGLKEDDKINESLLDQVNEQEPEPEEPGEEKGAVLEDATDKILGKFPTVKAAIIKLQSEDFKEFVESIDWISPRPTSFRVNLKNGQDYILKWTGKTFEAQILGKRYLLSNIAEYQQALDKLAILYKEAPMTGAGEGEPADTDTGGGGGGGGDFPGGDAAGGGEEGGDEVDALGGDEGGEEGGADLTGEPIDFEEPAEEPEA